MSIWLVKMTTEKFIDISIVMGFDWGSVQCSAWGLSKTSLINVFIIFLGFIIFILVQDNFFPFEILMAIE